jgi:hypothetical protein
VMRSAIAAALEALRSVLANMVEKAQRFIE